MSHSTTIHAAAEGNVTHRAVLAIAIPIMASNVSEPLIGVVDTWVIGRLPEAYYIGAIAIGALIFSFIFWGFGFLRLGTGGMTAQAAGARDVQEIRAVLGRALMIAGVCGVALIALSPLIESLSFWMISASDEVEAHARDYFQIRIFAAPFSLANYVILGWFIGLGRASTAFYLQLVLNISNIILDIVFVHGMGMTSDGVALGTLLAAIIAMGAGAFAVHHELKARGGSFNWPRIMDKARLKRMVTVNFNIMVRSLALVFAFSWFTVQSAKGGDIILAANTVLQNIWMISVFLIDGFAMAAEALVGQAVGATSLSRFKQAVRLTTLWAFVVAGICSIIIYVLGGVFIDALTVNEEVRASARVYLIWTALCPIIGVGCFQLDGIFIGATQTRDIRNMMLISMVFYFIAWWVFTAWFGNHGLWMAILAFFAVRGVTLWARMPALVRDNFPKSG
ncbi:MAG: MATE family efflux transporter [Hyphomicrobiales bacterium]